jgi:Glycogen recognition site of AMP-activated protein kinase
MKTHAPHTTKSPIPQQPVPSARPRKVGLVKCLLLACLLFSPTAAFAANTLTLDLAVQSITSSQPPRMVDDVLLLSYKPQRPVRFVGVRFEHEAWKILHPYTVNEQGVFVLDYPVPEGVQEIRYRMVVDGLWMPDPANPVTAPDGAGALLSVYRLESQPLRLVVNPRPDTGGALTFVFRGKPGRRVSIVGDFNNWDPFMDALDETSPGSYSVTLRVPAGDHWYYFFSDGRRILDRFNAQTGVDPDGGTVSYFDAPS